MSSKISISVDLRFFPSFFFVRGARCFFAGEGDGSAKGETSLAIGEMSPNPLSNFSESEEAVGENTSAAPSSP